MFIYTVFRFLYVVPLGIVLSLLFALVLYFACLIDIPGMSASLKDLLDIYANEFSMNDDVR